MNNPAIQSTDEHSPIIGRSIVTVSPVSGDDPVVVVAAALSVLAAGVFDLEPAFEPVFEPVPAFFVTVISQVAV